MNSRAERCVFMREVQGSPQTAARKHQQCLPEDNFHRNMRTASPHTHVVEVKRGAGAGRARRLLRLLSPKARRRGARLGGRLERRLAVGLFLLCLLSAGGGVAHGCLSVRVAAVDVVVVEEAQVAHLQLAVLKITRTTAKRIQRVRPGYSKEWGRGAKVDRTRMDITRSPRRASCYPIAPFAP